MQASATGHGELRAQLHDFGTKYGVRGSGYQPSTILHVTSLKPCSALQGKDAQDFYFPSPPPGTIVKSTRRRATFFPHISCNHPL